ATSNDAELELLNTLSEQAQEALQLLQDDQRYAASTLIVEESIEAIKGAPENANIAPTLLKDYSSYILERPGTLQYRKVEVEENIDRRNYKRADNINYLDGDFESHSDQTHWEGFEEGSERSET